jgi:hypothetical protein
MFENVQVVATPPITLTNQSNMTSQQPSLPESHCHLALVVASCLVGDARTATASERVPVAAVPAAGAVPVPHHILQPTEPPPALAFGQHATLYQNQNEATALRSVNTLDT